jgi:rare lipoprotein A
LFTPATHRATVIGRKLIIVVALQVCYYDHVRRLSLVICALVVLSACGHKKVQVRIPQPQSQPGSISSSELEGLASYYAEPYHGRKTANGEIFDTYQGMTAAHRTLPFNTLVRVTNKTNGREVDVRINDRGPFIDGRVIDLSLRAARLIDLVGPGVAPVKLKVIKQSELAASVLSLFAIQVGAFQNRRAADELKQKLEKKYPSVTVQEDKELYRVRIGEPDMETANKIATELRKDDLMPFIVRLN